MEYDRRCFIWAVSDFRSLRLKQTRKRHLKMMPEEGTDLTLVLFIYREDDRKDFLCIDINGSITRRKHYMTSEIAILDAKGTATHCMKKRLLIGRKPVLKIFEKDISELLSSKDTLFPNDVLTLRCEFECSAGPVWSIIEDLGKIESSKQQEEMPGIREAYIKEANNFMVEICPFTDVFYKFHLNKILTDVVLQTTTESFHVHKVVLCCRSEVFCAMLTEDTNEVAISNCVDITENADTLRSLLLYIYTSEVQEMQWKGTADLFKAADKYGLSELKTKCSVMLKSKISEDSFCSLMSIADKYHEMDIMDRVLDFMSGNLNVFKCEEWKGFKRENPELALDATERLIYSFNNSV